MKRPPSVECHFSWRFFGISIDAGDVSVIQIVLPFTLITLWR